MADLFSFMNNLFSNTERLMNSFKMPGLGMSPLQVMYLMIILSVIGFFLAKFFGLEARQANKK